MTVSVDEAKRARLILGLIQNANMTHQRSFQTLVSRLRPDQDSDALEVITTGLLTESTRGIVTPLPQYLDVLAELEVAGPIDWSVVASYLLEVAAGHRQTQQDLAG